MLLASPTLGSAAPPDAAAEAGRWLAARQRDSGDLPTYTGSGVGELVVALLSAGEMGEPVDRGLAYLRSRGEEVATGPAHAARIVMGLVTAGEDPRDPVDFVARIEAGYDATTGAWEDNVYANALAALGHVAAGKNLPGRAVTYLRAQQCASGGFAWRAGCVGIADVDTTSMVTSALLASGLPVSDTTISRARSYLMDVQNGDGGFGLEPGDPTNANSTGLALSTVAALGEDPLGAPWRRSSGSGPVSALLDLQSSDGGFRYLATSPEAGDYATVQAIPGLAGVAYPMPPTAREAEASGPDVGSDQPVTAEPRDSPPATGSPSAREARAGVVVQGVGSRERSFCVAFDEPSITGEELLRRTRLDIEVSRMQLGNAVCGIGGTGCGAGDCFCRFPTFWGYWTLDRGATEWTFSQEGAGARVVTEGALDAWVWAPDGKPPPARTTVEEVCAASETAVDDRASVAPGPRTRDAAGAPAAALVSFAGLGAILAAGGALVVWRRRRS